jgi:hypothetical protein
VASYTSLDRWHIRVLRSVKDQGLASAHTSLNFVDDSYFQVNNNLNAEPAPMYMADMGACSGASTTLADKL